MKKLLSIAIILFMVIGLSGCSASRSYTNLAEVEDILYLSYDGGVIDDCTDVTALFSGASYEFINKDKINFSITKVFGDRVDHFTNREYIGSAIVVGDIEEHEAIIPSTNERYTQRRYEINVIFDDNYHESFEVLESFDYVTLSDSKKLYIKINK